jgi:transcriptional regulator with XRE-family HTH domain
MSGAEFRSLMTDDIPPKTKIGPTDVYVGYRIRAARRDARMSQQALAALLKITYQQLQKYEKGVNRVSVSRMAEIATALGTTPGTLLQPVPFPARMDEESTPAAKPAPLSPFAVSREVWRLAFAFSAIHNPAMRGAILELVNVIAVKHLKTHERGAVISDNSQVPSDELVRGTDGVRDTAEGPSQGGLVPASQTSP